MINFSQKFICAYNENTSQHYILTQQLQPYIINLAHKPKDMQMIKVRQQFQQLSSVNTRDNVDEGNYGIVVNFKQIFNKFGININLCTKKQLYVAENDKYILFQQLCPMKNCIPLQYLQNSVILIRFRIDNVFQDNRIKYWNWKQDIIKSINSHKRDKHQQKIKEQQNSQSQGQHERQMYVNKQQINVNNQQIRDRDRSRSIGQIIQFVKKWRFLADQGINGKKLNYQQAAVYVGIPKKSLDDYYYQLRVGQKHHFDFEANFDKNISFLRKFVKQKVPFRNKSLKTAQHIKKEHQQEIQPQYEQKQYTKLPELSIFKNKSIKPKQQLNNILINNANANIQSTNFGQEHQNKVRRLSQSDSDISSLNIWPNANFIKEIKDNQNIFDQQDSFFNDFKFGVIDNYVSFSHLKKKQSINDSCNQKK